MKRDGAKCRLNQSASKKRFCVQLKQRKSMMPIIAPLFPRISEQMQGRNQVDINEIQTAVENQLMSGPYKQLARAYIEYRHDRDIEREKRGRLNQEIRRLVEQTNASLLNENANKDSKVIPTSATCWPGSWLNAMHASTCCRVTWCRHMSVAIFTITISITRRSSRCSTAC
ncbi:ATP cone domain-containing protein [Escherichia coli]